ncbi:Cytoplasmic protein, partial [Monkeypox virus]
EQPRPRTPPSYE